VKQETQTIGEFGKEARATRLITERASRRIGKAAFELALQRERKVGPRTNGSLSRLTKSTVSACYDHSQVKRTLRH
jgi:isocitrate/isopropylmalate dehydrogenase